MTFDCRLVTCVANEQLMLMNYIPEHFQDHPDSEYVSYVGSAVSEQVYH